MKLSRLYSLQGLLTVAGIVYEKRGILLVVLQPPRAHQFMQEYFGNMGSNKFIVATLRW